MLIFLGDIQPESKLALLLARFEGSCRIESGMIDLAQVNSEEEESDPTDSKDSEGVEGGLFCSLDSSNLYIMI